MTHVSEWENNRIEFTRHMSGDGIASFAWWSTAHKALITGAGHVGVQAVDMALDGLEEWRSGRLRDVVKSVPPILKSGPSWLRTRHGVYGTELLQAYYFILFSRAFPGFRDMDIIEFGGGLGSFCRICKGMGHDGRYVIYDFPEIIEIQRYVLSECAIGGIEFMQHPSVPPAGGFDCLVSICALSETDVDESERWIGREAVLRSSPGAMFLVYQGDFGGVDNRKFFPKFGGDIVELVTGHELQVTGGAWPILNLP